MGGKRGEDQRQRREVESKEAVFKYYLALICSPSTRNNSEIERTH